MVVCPEMSRFVCTYVSVLISVTRVTFGRRGCASDRSAGSLAVDAREKEGSWVAKGSFDSGGKAASAQDDTTKKRSAVMARLKPRPSKISCQWSVIGCQLSGTAGPSTARSPDPQGARIEEKMGECSAQDDSARAFLWRKGSFDCGAQQQRVLARDGWRKELELFRRLVQLL